MPGYDLAGLCADFHGLYPRDYLAGALRQTPNGEVEAARSLGMYTAAIYRRILLPGAVSPRPAAITATSWSW